MKRAQISAVVLTRDEELNLPACLDSLHAVVDEIYVVDSGSTDATRAIAEAHGATFVEHEFCGHSEQWRWALEQLPLAHNWILGLDADQRLTPELADELCGKFSDTTHTEYAGYYVARRNVFRGRWIRWGGYYPKYLLKLFRRDRLMFDDADVMDHHFRVNGTTARLNGDIIEENRKEENIDFWLRKHLGYSDLLAAEELRRAAGQHSRLVRASLFGTPDERAEWLKHTWHRLPRIVRPAGYFIWRYFFRFGFLDGKQGFVFHFLHAFWFRLITDLKLDELERDARSGD